MSTPAVAQTTPAPTEPELEFLGGPLPSDTELDEAVGAALDAYLNHRTLYDEAFRTGFVDEQLVDELVATTSGDLRDMVREAAEQYDAGPVEGSSEVLEIGATTLRIPASTPKSVDITFDTCILITGGSTPADRGELAVTVTMINEDSRWVVWSQRDYGNECPG